MAVSRRVWTHALLMTNYQIYLFVSSAPVAEVKHGQRQGRMKGYIRNIEKRRIIFEIL